VSHTATLATALYSVFWDFCKCPGDGGSDRGFAAAAFSFAQPLRFWPTAWLSQVRRITVIPGWCQVGGRRWPFVLKCTAIAQPMTACLNDFRESNF